MTPEQVATSLFLMNPYNKKSLKKSIKQLNNYLSSLNPDLTIEQKLELLTSG